MSEKSTWKQVGAFPVSTDVMAMLSLETMAQGFASSVKRYYFDSSNWALALPLELICPESGDNADRATIEQFSREAIDRRQLTALVSVDSAARLDSLLLLIDEEDSGMGPLALVGLLVSSAAETTSSPPFAQARLGEAVAELRLRGLLETTLRFRLYPLTQHMPLSREGLESLPKLHFEEGDNLSRREEWFQRRSGKGKSQ